MAEMNVNIYMNRDYEDNHALKAAKNKANQSQFRLAPSTAGD